ncbi:MAG: S8 family serine peptidase [Ruminococcus sp.]|nr:S8 family serine peptidase [Ruminococcus sp.]
MQKKKSLFPLVFAVLTAFALLIGTLDVFVYAKYIRGGRLNKLRHPTEKVDMTDPDGNTDYGRIYYAPIDEEHVVEYEEDSGCGYIDNEVLVVAGDGVSREQIAELAAKYDAEIVGEIEVSGDYQLRLATAPDELDSVVESISAEPVVDSAEVNYVMPISGDSEGDVGNFYYGDLWQSELTAEEYDSSTALSWGFHEINTPMAWALLTANRDVVNPVKVGVCDCGFEETHPDLGFVSVFYDNGDRGMTTKKFYVDNGRDHGTHVSGTFAANADNTGTGSGICGVYPYGNGRLYASCVTQADKYTDDTASNRSTTMGTKAAFAELIVRDVKVINFSVGFNDYSFQYNDIWHKETSKAAKSLAGFYDRMLKKGYDFVISASAGNSSSKLTGHLEAKYNSSLCLIEQSDYPDVYNRIIVVGSLDRDLSISDFSNGGDRTDIYAPGGDIYSALYSDLHSGELYGSKDGTSMAAPHVAGVAAMVWSANASLTGEEVKDIVVSTADTEKTTVPVLDAARAVEAALDGSVFAPHLIHTNAAIVGKVCKKSLINSPIEGAKITAVEQSTDKAYTTTSDHDGQFDIILPAGKYIFTIEADGYKTYTSEEIILSNNSVYNARTIKLKKGKSTSTSTKPSYNAEGKLEEITPTPVAGKIYTNEDISKFLPSKFGKFDIGIGLDKIRAWTYYEGHYYAIFDHAMSAKVMSLATQQDPNVHLVTITSEEEQTLIEELMLYGGRDVYYTGGMVDEDGDVYTVNGEDTDYTHWYEGYPDSYGNEGKDDIIAIFRGTIDEPKSSPDYGYWFDLNEDEYNLFDFADLNVDGATRGIIIEWDKAVTEETTE